jgi:hypothetical protein
MDLAEQKAALQGDDEKDRQRLGVRGGRQLAGLGQLGESVTQSILPTSQARGDDFPGCLVLLGDLAAERTDGTSPAAVERAVRVHHEGRGVMAVAASR